MKWWIIIIIIVAVAIGYYSYRFIPFYYTPNIPPLIDISSGELEALQEKLNQENLTEKERQEIINRQEEIYNLLSQFFGTDIRLI